MRVQIMPFDVPSILMSAAPGVGAALLSVYNFLKARRGAVINISDIYQFGVINIYDDGKDFKLLYLSIPFENDGTSIGAINSIKLELTWDNNRTVLYPIRRIELSKPENDAVIHQEDFVEQFPILPVYVPPSSGAYFSFEFHDVGENPFPIKEKIKARILVKYSGKQKTEKEFVLQVTERSWNRSESYDLAISYDFIGPQDDPEFEVVRLWGNAKDAI
jgi:hypothetical protein